jgi:glycosyltransferase involved in cell wall biosynthesis
MNAVRIAWFSPVPPVRTGIAGRSAELIEALRRRGHAIEVFDEASAHDFVWIQQQRPFDLIVYQFGNSSHHDYEWAYALRYPGLVVLHDTRLHHARAALLLRERRAADYRAEFAWNHPGVRAGVAELAVAGFDSRLYYDWPMVRSLVERSRLVAVHGEAARRELLEMLSTTNPQTPNSEEVLSRIIAIRLGEGETLTPEREAAARQRVRAAHGIREDAVLFGIFGGLTPEKRIPQILAAFRAALAHDPRARLLFAGAPAAHYDLESAIAAHALKDRATVTGYLASDEELTDHLAACDVSLNLRWPTARETSGPWLRALAAGRATIVTDLVHMTGFAALDPRTWTPFPTPHPSFPVCVAVDLLDEDHSLRLAMRRLAADGELRRDLGRAAIEWWKANHSVDRMVDDYESAFARCASFGEIAPSGGNAGGLPHHLRPSGDDKLRDLLEPFGLDPGLLG